MEWLILVAAVIYLSLSLAGDGFDALLLWLSEHPRAVLRAIAVGLIWGTLGALFKGQVTATIYIVAGSLAGLANLIYDWLKSRESR